jgi:hypothetical protein
MYDINIDNIVHRAIARGKREVSTSRVLFPGVRKNEKFAFHVKNYNGKCRRFYVKKMLRPLHQLKQLLKIMPNNCKYIKIP